MLSIGIPVPNYTLGRERGKEQKSTFFFRKQVLLKNTIGQIMICSGWSVLPRRKSQDILKTCSCPD